MRPSGSVVVVSDSSTQDDEQTMLSAITSGYSDGSEGSSDILSQNWFCTLPPTSALYGRENEQKLLKEALFSVVSKPSKVVHVCGSSGTGKSSLVEYLRIPAAEQGAFFVSGKYDAVRQPEPFSEIVTSLSDLCDLIVQSEELLDTRDRVRKAMTMHEIHGLLPLVSSLQDVVGLRPSAQFQTYSWRQSFLRFKVLCRKFIQAVASSQHPVVWFLDDLQWADEASVTVIKSLATDIESKNVLLVLAYRTKDEGVRSRAFESFLNSTLHHEAVANATCTDEDVKLPYLDTLEINVENLTVAQVNELVLSRVKPTIKETEGLSEVILAKTHGNAFCVIEFLDMLLAEELITTSTNSENYEWCLETIQARTNVSDTVVPLLLTKIERLPEKMQDTLRIASCIAFHFELDVLDKVIKVVASQGMTFHLPRNKQELRKLMTSAAQVGLVEIIKEREIKFAHDKVRMSLYNSLSDQDVLQNIHLHVGHTVQTMIDNQELKRQSEKLLFLAADQSNLGSAKLTSTSDKLELARLNLEAGRASMSKHDCATAARYWRKAVDQLPVESKWEESTYPLTLDCYLSLARAESAAGVEATTLDRTIEEIAGNATSLEDRLEAYKVAMNTHHVQGNLSSALDYGKMIIGQLGEPFPRRTVGLGHVAAEFVRTKLALRKFSDEMILTLPEATDKGKIMAITTLHHMGRSAFSSDQPKVMLLCYTRGLRLTLKHGLSLKTPSLFAKYGMIQAVLGNHELSNRYGQLALKLLKRPTIGEEQEAETIFYTFTFSAHWQLEPKELLTSFQRGHESGMRSGEVYASLLNAISIASTSFSMGVRLEECEDICRGIYKTATEYNMGIMLSNIRPLWQIILNLRNESENPMVLTGEAMDEDKMLANNPSTMCRHQVALGQIVMAFIFQEWDYLRDAIPAIEKIRKSVKGITAHAFSWEYLCLAGTSYFVLQRKDPKPGKYRSFATKALKTLKTVVRAGRADCEHFYLLMLAEDWALRSRDAKVVKSLYDDAIRAAAKLGATQYKAIALERAGRTLLELRDRDRARKYFDDALEAFREWGADAKCEQLKGFMQMKFLMR